MLDEKAMQSLLSKLCVDLGFCLDPEKENFILKSPPDSVESFADVVFIAEGLDPEQADRRLYKRVRDVVADAFQKYYEESEYYESDV